MKEKEIIFKAKNETGFKLCLPPVPASTLIPEWWKSMAPYHGTKLNVENLGSNASPKKCTPMLDALTNGYIIQLWADVQIKQFNNMPRITWKIESQDVFQQHGLTVGDMVPPPTGYNKTVFKFMNTWIPILPKGYSYAVVEPFGYRDLPFRPIPAVIDGDKSTLEIVAPVWVKEGYEGIVEKGTPILQIIPFKRDNWKSKLTYYPNGEYDIVEDKNFNGTIVGHYIKNVWSKKVFK